jgi:hypothetical protein
MLVIDDNNFNMSIEDVIENFYISINNKLIGLNRKFIEYDIDIDNIDKLKEYIDIKEITTFPHINKTNYSNFVNNFE